MTDFILASHFFPDTSSVDVIVVDTETGTGIEAELSCSYWHTRCFHLPEMSGFVFLIRKTPPSSVSQLKSAPTIGIRNQTICRHFMWKPKVKKKHKALEDVVADETKRKRMMDQEGAVMKTRGKQMNE